MLVCLACLCSYRFIRAAKYLITIADVFIILGIILVPLGCVQFNTACRDV